MFSVRWEVNFYVLFRRISNIKSVIENIERQTVCHCMTSDLSVDITHGSSH